MQKISTRIFIYSSVVFGILGIIRVLTLPDSDQDSSSFDIIIMKLMMATVFVILPSFALSIAGKYLKSK